MPFDLEKALAAWRRPYEVNPAFSADDLEELENSLRERIEALVGQGLSEKEAFGSAVQRVGSYGTAETEYKKVYWGKLKREHRLGSELIWRLSMLKNYVKIAWRTLCKQKGYAVINATGLAVGLAGSFFILLWVQDELRYDRFLDEGDRIHTVLRRIQTSDNQTHTWSSNAKPLAAALKADYPEIEEAVLTRWPQKFVVTLGEESFRETGNYASASFFKVFAFPFIQGSPETALQDESAAVITDRTARKLFGEQWQERGNVIGQTVTIDHRKAFTVSGVIEDLPKNASLQFDVLLPIQDFFSRHSWVEFWGNNSFPLYAKLQEGAQLADVNDKIADVIMKHHDAENVEVFLQPYEDQYLYAGYRDGKHVGGRIEYVRIFSIVAIFLLLIACINFTNLATARSSRRAREIGVRKVVGAHQKSLMVQFLGESMLFAFMALILALSLLFLLLPFFNELTNKHIALEDMKGLFLVGVLGITLVVGLVAGGYPALYLSSFHPLKVLRGSFRLKPGAALLRKSLVTIQFTLSVLLIVSTLAVYLQIQFIQTRNLGLDRDNVVYLKQEGGLLSQYEAVRQALLNRPGIAQVTSTDTSPLAIGTSTGDARWAGKDPNDEHDFHIIGANYDFLETMKMEVLAGRSFSREFGADSTGYLVNEETAKIIGGEVLGVELSFWGRTGPIIGVVKNFEMNSMYTPMEPVIIRLDPENTSMLYVRTRPGQTEEAIASLSAVFAQFNTGYPFDYGFLDQDFEATYRSETILGQLAGIFAFIAIFISCLGLFGLVSFTAEQRTKEIGVRKVLGATVPNLVRLLTGEITKPVLMGIAIAIPVAYLVVRDWLADFEYHIEIGAGLFIVAGAVAILIAWLTVSFQAVKAAVANPVKSLRYE